jgi:hypothetical protein
LRSSIARQAGREEWAQLWPEDVIVRDRVVHFWISEDEPEQKRRALRIAAENVDGVQRVEEHLVPAYSFPAF